MLFFIVIFNYTIEKNKNYRLNQQYTLYYKVYIQHEGASGSYFLKYSSN